MMVQYRATGCAKFLQNARLKRASNVIYRAQIGLGLLSFAGTVNWSFAIVRRRHHFIVIDQTSASLLTRLR